MKAIDELIEKLQVPLISKRELIEDLEQLKAELKEQHKKERYKDEGQATLTEYALELIDIETNPQNSNVPYKVIIMQNTIGKLHDKIKQYYNQNH